MSIKDEIENCVRQGRLFLMQATPAYRTMLVGEKLWKVLLSPREYAPGMYGPFQDENFEGVSEEFLSSWEDRIGSLKGSIEAFIHLDELGPEYLFCLSPEQDGVWEIRSIDEKPSIRVLGMFAFKDCFLALDYELRECLGGWNSFSWKQRKRNTRAVWRQLFPSYDPLVGSIIPTGFFSGALNGKYSK